MRAGRLVIAFGLLIGAVTSASAQNAQCEPYAFSPSAERVCNAAIDATVAFHPVVGLLVSGGNPVIGTAGALGGLGHFSFTVRANGTNVVLPVTDYDGSTAEVPADEEIFAPAPLVEAAVGIYRGLPSGLLSIDLLGSAQLLPTDQIDNFSIDDDARRIGDIALGLGYGVRIGVLREMGPLPGVSVSIMRRDIPQVRYGSIADGDDYAYAVDLHATNLRAIASKRLAILSVAAGLGWDKYTGDATIAFRNPITDLAEPPIEIEPNSSRAMAFLDAGLDLSVLKLVGEVGYQTGDDQDISTDFEDFDTEKGRWFAGFGLRFAI